MTIDWINFTPWISSIGGLLIGFAASLLIVFNGKIAGISGILAGLLTPVSGELLWRIAFVSGLILSPLVYHLVAPLPSVQIHSNAWLIMIAGVLVGFGSRYGSGCTSGHGVCGISRFSRRSFVATACFISSGFLTVLLVRHYIG
ncbi:MAG TPA: YeeE/YedE family protein [Methylotenera sp.]|nr:YeeE/YedE family protein [Methylotenera sp.]